MSELRDLRLDRLEEDVREIKATLVRLEPMIIRIDATLPHLATKEELAEKPSRAYLWGVMAALVGAQAVALAAAGLLFSFLTTRPAATPPPAKAASLVLAEDVPAFDWDLWHARQDACRDADRIAAQCGQGHCDEPALRQARRLCSAFGPLGGRRS